MGVLAWQWPLKRVALFAREFATLYRGNIAPVRALELIAGRVKPMRPVLMTMADAIRRGDTLAGALRAQSRYFPTLYVGLASVGEKTGALDVVLPELAAYYEEQLAIRRAIIRGLVYPAAILFAAIFLIPILKFVLSSIVMPGASGDLERFLWYMAIHRGLPLAGIWFARTAVVRMAVLRPHRGAIAGHAWPFSLLFRKFAAARVLRGLALLLDAGFGPVPAIQRAAALTDIPAMRRDFLRAIPVVRDGGTFFDAFSRSRHLPAMAIAMLDVGEQSGKVGDMLKRTGDYLHEDAMHTLKIIARIEEAIVTVLLALILFGG